MVFLVPQIVWELRYDHSYDRPAYDSPCLQLGCPGSKKNQLTFAGDAILLFLEQHCALAVSGY
jgi:hypothetical protein